MKRGSLLLGILIPLILAGCAGKPPTETPKDRLLYELGLKSLLKKEYPAAQAKFSQLLDEFPSTRWLPQAYYNLGLSLEGQGKHAEAVEKYKKVVEFYQGNHTRDEADALYRLSMCYENLGDDPKMIVALLELDTHAQYLSGNTGKIELPARLAAAYARMGNLEQAKIYYDRAEHGLKRMRRVRLTEDVLAWLPKTLYSMGKLAPMKPDFTEEEFNNYVGTLEKSQSWLLRSAELGDNEWSKKASVELITAYNEVWNYINSIPMPVDSDSLHSLKQRQQKQKRLAAILDKAINKLKAERLPSTPASPEVPQVTEVFKNAGFVERQVDMTIQERDVQDQKTVEAQKREGLKRTPK